MTEKKASMYGVIHIGSSNLSMKIVSYAAIDDIRVIESVRKQTSFGEEVFLNKKLSFSSIRRLCDMLRGLKQLLDDYQVTEYKVYATAVLREAENCLSVLDLIRVNTGFTVQVVDMPQEIYYKHFWLQYGMRKMCRDKKYDLGENLLFVDITSGCVGFTLWTKGTLTYQHNVHIGTLRLLETFKSSQRESQDFPRAMEEYIHAIMEPLWGAINRYHPLSVIFSGREAGIIMKLMQLPVGEGNITEVNLDVFKKFYSDLGFLSMMNQRDEKVIDEWQSMTIWPSIYIYKEIINHVSANHILISGISFVEAVTGFYGAEKHKESAILYMRGQNLELTRAIAKSYYYETAHTKALEYYSHMILLELKKYGGITDRDEFLLRMAIILYQIGKYVNLLDSSLHAWNLIRGTDIFGISDKEKDIVACIVYYDHKGTPQIDEKPYAVISDMAKIVVLKLIAIFRLVRAMDISRKQKMKDVMVRMSGDCLLIEYDSDENTALERWIFEKNKELFENVYGVAVKLEKR